MVRALLAGTKTQTRRLLWNPEYYGCPTGDCPHMTQAECNVAMAALSPKEANGYASGDRLYVRENWTIDPNGQEADGSIYGKYQATPEHGQVRFAPPQVWKVPRNAMNGGWVPCIHMPRWASRLWLDVTEVRVQRLQDISEEDCIAEGIERSTEYPNLWHRGPLKGDQNNVSVTGFPTLAYRSIWEALHTKPGERWEDNPWIVAVSFTVHHGNVDEAAR